MHLSLLSSPGTLPILERLVPSSEDCKDREDHEQSLSSQGGFSVDRAADESDAIDIAYSMSETCEVRKRGLKVRGTPETVKRGQEDNEAST